MPFTLEDKTGTASCSKAGGGRRALKPFLRWPGGKRWLTSRLGPDLPRSFNRYIEPFLGSGAVYFYLAPEKAIIADINSELIATYIAVRESPNRVEEILRYHQARHCKQHYYAMRAQEPMDSIDRAARFIYLNRTCFNGIYRVNSEGKFNVPIGSKSSVLLDTDDFVAAARQLTGSQILCADFAVPILQAQEGDLVFADPPYVVGHNSNGFLKYNERLFSWDDQVRLAHALRKAVERGAYVLATNANHAAIRDLYSGLGFGIRVLERHSTVSGSSGGRKHYQELLIQGANGGVKVE